MEKSKQANESKLEDDVDRISTLPIPILHLILSSIEEIVRTSILSRQWRYLWTSLPSIDIDLSQGSESKRNVFKKFVDHVLSDNSLNLDSMRLSCSDPYYMWTVGQWIQSAVMRNIKHLHLLFCLVDRFEIMPNCLVNCGSLEVLRLSLSGWRISLPNLTGFRALRVLVLNNVELHKSQFEEQFLVSCPLLEDLSLIDCLLKRFEAFYISCPKLKNLRLDNRNFYDWHELDRLCGCIEIVCPKLEFFEFGAFLADKLVCLKNSSFIEESCDPS